MKLKERYGRYRRVASGKVREIYELDDEDIIALVATDRVSAFDQKLGIEIPDKGKILTSISAEMFTLAENAWELPTAFIWGSKMSESSGGLFIETGSRSTDVREKLMKNPDQLLPPDLAGRVTKMEKLEMLEVECIVRGHISGSAWELYKQGQHEICGVSLPDGLKSCSKFPKPIFTPTTKAPEGEHDENITFGEMSEIIGDQDIADEVYCLCMEMFNRAYRYLEERGIILADTKFELGLDELGNVKFGDELLTPDSSRYWDAVTFAPGEEPLSYDKQIIRDYLAGCKQRGEQVDFIPDTIIEMTRQKYIQLYEIITGYPWPE